MRKVWALSVGLMAAMAACGGDDGDDDTTGHDDGGTSSGSSTSGNASSGSAPGGSSSSSTSSSGGSTSSSGGSSTSSASSSSSGDPDAGDAGEEPDAADVQQPPQFQYAQFDLNHLLVTGQSNALGIGGGTVVSTVPRGAGCAADALDQCSGLMFSSGVFPSTDCHHDQDGCETYQPRTAFLPLVEGDDYGDEGGSYPLETPGSGLANQAAELAASVYFPGVALGPSGVRMLVSNDARSGNIYGCLAKGSCPEWFGGAVPVTVKQSFADGLDQIHQAKLIAQAKNWTYAVRGVFAIHGEADHDLESEYLDSEFPRPATSGVGQTNDYKEALLEWQRDYETAIQAETGQVVPVPMFITQLSNWTWISYGHPNNATTSKIPYLQLDAFRANPTKLIIATPTYPFTYNDTEFDKVHLQPTSSRRVGEYLAKAYAQTTFTAVPWKPLYPLHVTRNGAVIRVQYHVPVAPLAFDVVAVTDPNGHHGFTYTDDSGAPASVQSEAIDGDTVVVTLSKDPGNAANKRIRYAYDGVAGNAGGRTTGPRGNLRDSDPTVSASGGAPLVNWSLAFNEPVP